MSPTAPARKRNAAATREAILASARAAFAKAGYDGAGVREIAAGAGVTAMLVNRYFGSKEDLFAEVLADAMATPNIIKSDILKAADIGERLAAALIEQTDAKASPLDGFLILLRSTSNPRAAEIGRKQIEKYHHKQMTAAAQGNLAPQRAAIALSLIAGFQIMRQMIGLTALAKADPSDLERLLVPVFDAITSGKLDAETAPQPKA